MGGTSPYVHLPVPVVLRTHPIICAQVLLNWGPSPADAGIPFFVSLH